MKIPRIPVGPAGPHGEDNRPRRLGGPALKWTLAAVLAGALIVALGLAAQPPAHESPGAASGAASGAAPGATPGAAANATTGAAPGAVPAEPRAALRLVHLTTAPDAVSTATRIVAVLLSGPMPHGTVQATVMTDENCDPDAQGYSHCRNDVRLADGSVLHLRHTHRMGMVECLIPGEHVIVKGV
jgi:hypothetical protein